MAIEFFCSHCRQLVRTPDSAAGRKGVCPNCRSIIAVPQSRPAPALPTAPRVGIDFECPACGQVSRAPAAAAGKRGKCPECQTVLTIPGHSTVAVDSVSPPAEVSDPWSDLPLPPGPAAKGAAPPPQLSTAAAFGDEPQPALAEETPAWVAIMERARTEQHARGGLAWDRDATLGSLFDTTFHLCTNAGPGFDDMAIEGGYSTPLTFYIFSMILHQLATVLFYTGWFLLLALSTDAFDQVDWMALFQLACFLSVVGAVYSAVGGTISAFISAWCIHLALLMFGGVRHGYEATFRVLCYSFGACTVLGATIVFSPIVVIFAFLLPIWGLARVHNIPAWKSALAFLIGIILTICAMVTLVFVAFVLVIKSLIVTLQLQDYFGPLVGT